MTENCSLSKHMPILVFFGVTLQTCRWILMFWRNIIVFVFRAEVISYFKLYGLHVPCF
jgi:ribosomal silencing factor RsfS